nr:MAG TPA: hypothetical protein [Caudoviricetes sp.]
MSSLTRKGLPANAIKFAVMARSMNLLKIFKRARFDYISSLARKTIRNSEGNY